MKKVALVGLGRWGKNICNELTHLNCEVTVVLHSSDPVKELWLAEHAPDARHTYALMDVLTDQDISHVCVATPMQTHFEIAYALASTSKTVFLEKPITDDAVTALKLLSVFREGPAKLMVGHIFLYHDCFVRIKKELEGADIRSVLITKTSRTGDSVHASNAHFLDAFIHETSVLLSLFGMPQKLQIKGEGLVFEFDKFRACVNIEPTSEQKVRRFAFETGKGKVIWENEAVYRDREVVFSSVTPALERELTIFLDEYEKWQEEIQANNKIAMECVELLETARLKR